MLLKDLNSVEVGTDSEIVLKPKRERAVRAVLKGRDVLAVLPKGYEKKKKKIVSQNFCSL